MYQPQGPHSNLLSKDLEGATQTQTYTEKPYSYFDPTHEEAMPQQTEQKVQIVNDPQMFLKGQKTLTKVKSLPLTLYNPLNDGYHSKSGENLQIRKQTNLEETANRITKHTKNAQFANFSPIPNRVKSYDLNRSFNTNLESKEFIGHDFTINRTPNVNFDKFNVQGSSGYIDPITFQTSFQDRTKLNMSPIRQERPQPKSLDIVNVPVPNVRVPFNQVESQIINKKLSQNNQAIRPSVAFQKPQNLTYNSQQIKASNVTSFDNRVQYQSIIYDPVNQGNVQSLNTRREKISFAKLQSNPQQFGEVEFQRPQFKKLYDNKDESFRTVGPQDDYYKEQKTTCSKILPILGVIIFLLLLAGTFFGIGVMTGMFGGKNYLSKKQGDLIQKYNQGYSVTQDVYVNDEVGNEENQLTKQNQIEDGVVQPTVLTPPISEKPLEQVPKIEEVKEQQVVPEKIEPMIDVKSAEIPKTQTTPVIPEKKENVKLEPVVDVKPTETPSIQASTLIPENPVVQQVPKFVQVTIPAITIPQIVKPAKKQPISQIPASIEPQVVMIPRVQPISQTVEPEIVKPIQKIQVQKTETQQVKPSQVQPIAEPVKEQPLTQPQKSIEELADELFKPISEHPVIEQASIEPQVTPVQKQIPIPIEKLPVTSPSGISNVAQKSSIPEKETTTIEPITLDEAGKVVDVIIEQNSQIIPTNFKAPLKKDILNEFEAVPVNWRDVPHVEKITYRHLEAFVKSDPSHSASLGFIRYRHHEVKKN